MLTDNLATGAVVFRKSNGSVQWLVVKYREREVWELPKGEIKRGESSVGSIIRILREDSGLSIRILEEVGRIGGPKSRLIFYLGTQLAKLSKQSGYSEQRWLPYSGAYKILSASSEKKILRQANVVFKELKKRKKD